MSTTNSYKPSDNLSNMIIKNIVWGSAGIILGLIINNSIIYISNSHEKNKTTTIILLEIALQLSLCSIVLALIHSQFNYIGWTWQSTTPGFVFVSFFFGVQYNIFTNIQNNLIPK